MATTQSTGIPAGQIWHYQVIYTGRDHAVHASPRFATADQAREHLDTVIIGGGLVVKVYADTGDIFPVQLVAADGGVEDYMDGEVSRS